MSAPADDTNEKCFTFFSLQALTAFEIISKSISRYFFLLKPTFDCVVPIAASTTSLPSITFKYELKSLKSIIFKVRFF